MAMLSAGVNTDSTATSGDTSRRATPSVRRCASMFSPAGTSGIRATPDVRTASPRSFASAVSRLTHSGVSVRPRVSMTMTSLARPALEIIRRARSSACSQRLMRSSPRAAMEGELSSTSTTRWAIPPNAGACGRVSARAMLNPVASASINENHQRQRSSAGRCAISSVRQIRLDATLTRSGLGLSQYISTISNATLASRA